MAVPAFGLKYKVPYTNYYGANREIRIFKDGYGAAPIEWNGGKTPWILDKGDSDDLFGGLIVSGVATIEVLVPYQFDMTEFMDERQSHLVHWYDLDNNKILWSGWIEPYDGSKPYSKPPHYVTLKATCGLAQLKKIKYQQSSVENPKKVALDVIRRMLFLTGHSLNINTSVFTLEITMPANSDPLLGYRLNTNRYFLTSGQRMYAYDALLDLLERHNCEIVQENNEWIIRSLPDQARGIMGQRNYLPGGTFNLYRELNLNYVVNKATHDINNGRALSLATGAVTVLRPIKRWSAFADLLPYANPFANGDLNQWNGTTFPGWNLDHAVGRWSKFTTADPLYPNGLQISGVVYGTDIFKYKTNFWGKTIKKWKQPEVFIDAPILPFDTYAQVTAVNIKYRLEGPFTYLHQISAFVTVWTERANGADRKYLQEDGGWSDQWGCVAFKGGTPELSKTPSEMKLLLKTRTLNSTTEFKPNKPIPSLYETLHVRIYPALVPTYHAEDPTVMLKIYSVDTQEENTERDAKPTNISYSLSTSSIVEDEVNRVNLLTAEVHGNYLTGIMLQLNNDVNTADWRRQGYVENKTALGVMITDRIAMTAKSLNVIQCDIKVIVDTPAAIFQFQNYLIFSDISPTQRFKILRYKLDDLRGTVTVTAAEFKHADAPNVTGATQVGDGAISYDNNGDSSVTVPVDVPVADGQVSPEDEYDPEAIIFEKLPAISFIVDKAEVKDLDFVDFLYPDDEEEDIPDLSTLAIQVLSKPDFISKIEINGLVLTITAKPKVTGSYSIPFIISDTETGEATTGNIVVTVYPAVKSVVQLIDEGSGGPTILGNIPGMYFLPDKIDIRSKVTGEHNKVIMKLTGGGLAGDAITETREVAVNYLEDDFSYLMFLAESGIVAPVGVYEFSLEVLRESEQVFKNEYGFTLYDEAYLALLKTYLTLATADVGEISPDGTTVFLNQKTGNIKDVIDGIDHDKITQELSKDGVVIKTTIHDVLPEASVGEYYLFDEDAELAHGVYSYAFLASLTTETTFKRVTTFEIAEADPKPEPGLKLETFKPGTINHTTIAELPLKGSEYDLPANFTVMFDGLGGIPYWSVEWEQYRLTTAGAFAPINIENYTGYPQNINYGELVTNEKLLIFGLKNSTQIGDIHQAPTTLRTVFTARDENGKIVGIRQADYSFRIPLAPEDYSGLRFITINQDNGFGVTLVDGNMPKADRKYLLPALPEIWSVSARKINGLLFDEVTLELSKNGVWLHSNAIPDAVTIYTADGPITEVESDVLAYIVGTTGVGGRTLKDPAGVPVLIDDLGDYVVRATFTLAGAEIGVLESAYSLIEEPDEIPIDDCCGGGSVERFTAIIGDGVSTSFTLTHNFGTKAISVEVYEIATGEKVYTGVLPDTINTVTITFKYPPATNTYEVVVI